MSEVLFIEARRKFDLNSVNFSVLDSLEEGSVSLAGTVQYLDLIIPVKEYLKKKGREVLVTKGAMYSGHVLGCNANALSFADNYLLLCDGKFHALNNAILKKKEIFIFNGESLEKVEKKEIDQYFKRLEGKKKKFLMAKNVGLIVSTKIGQNLNDVLGVKGKIERVGKKVYVFEGDSIDIGDFENYPDIPVYINSACFGLARDDTRIINLSDILEFL